MRRWLNLAICCALVPLLVACAGAPAKGSRGEYTVRPGDTLYSIAWRYGLEYRDLARWNGIGAPYRIHNGQRLRLNPGGTSARRGTAQAGSRGAQASGSASAGRAPAPATRTPIRSETTTPVKGWQWPTDGEVSSRFSADAPGKKGIDIAGSPGQAVRASAAGEVVYSGGGLIGYGQLIIVSHNKNYLSAYGHNRRLLVKEGDRVQAGQQIAELGSTGTDRPLLHFEIRRNGKPVDPLAYLPQR
jgi:lipoprotein NlpD